jgi:signal transduction histidine kinase
VWALRARLPLLVEPSQRPRSGSLGSLAAPAGIATQIALAVLFAAAAAGFIRRAELNHDAFAAWLGCAAVVGVFERVNYALYPSLYSDWVYSGEVLRICFFLLLLGGAAVEIAAYWSTARDLAILEERRRLARELHDGVAQELGYIVSRGTAMQSDRRDASLSALVSAAERALAESRRAISALSESSDRALDVALAETTEEAAGREGAAVRLDLDHGLTVSPDVQDALLRIAREAVTNAARHGHARTIAVQLKTDVGVDDLVLRVRDDGCGFDPTQMPTDRFGLVGMSERARALGGDVRIRSRPGFGAQVEVVLPRHGCGS